MHTLNGSFSKCFTIIILARLQFSERFGTQVENSNLFLFLFSFFPFPSHLYFTSVLAISENIGLQNSRFILSPVKWLQYFGSYVFKSLARITCCFLS